MGCHDNAEQYDTIMHISLQWQKENINQGLHSQQTPHILTDNLWSVYCEDLGENCLHKATFTHVRSGCGAETGVFWHRRSATAGMFTHTRRGRGPICHFLRTKMVWSMRFRSGREKLGVGPVCRGADFAPAPPPLRDRVCVNACNDLCWSQFSAHLCLRPLHACVNVPL